MEESESGERVNPEWYVRA